MQLSDGMLFMLEKLWSKKRIGGKHTEEQNCLRWIKHLPLIEQKQIIADWEYCIKQLGWVIRMKKNNEIHVSLNPRKLAEVLQVIGDGHGRIL